MHVTDQPQTPSLLVFPVVVSVKFVTCVHLCSVCFLSLVPQSGSSWFVVELGFRQCSFMR